MMISRRRVAKAGAVGLLFTLVVDVAVLGKKGDVLGRSSVKPLEEKLRTAIISRVRFEDVTIEEAISYLRRLGGCDPILAEDRTINIVSTRNAEERRFDDTILSLDRHNVSLGAALRAIGRSADLEVHVDEHAVVMANRPVLEKLELGANGLPLKRAMEKAVIRLVRFDEATLEEGMQFLGAMAQQEAAEGAVLREGLNVVLLGDLSTLTLNLSNVPLSEAIRYAASQTGAKVRVEEHAVVIAKDLPPEPPVKDVSAVEAEMRALRIAKMDVFFATMPSVVSFWQEKVMEAGAEIPISLEGDVWGEPERQIDIDLSNIPLWEAVRYSAMQAGAEVKIIDGGIMISPEAF